MGITCALILQKINITPIVNETTALKSSQPISTVTGLKTNFSETLVSIPVWA
jgi:hypothetical protein